MNRPTVWAVLPVKSFACAKRRLASLLDARERAALAEAMFEDVLQVLVNSPVLAGTLVVTKDATAAAISRAAGAEVLPDPAEAGLAPAVEHAACSLASAGRAGMLVVPADLPLITAADIARIVLAHGRPPAVTLVPASRDGGTNALACSPPQAVPVFFGEDSFRRHQHIALELGLIPNVLKLPRLARDIDRPDDLFDLVERPSATRTHAYLTGTGIAGRLSRLLASGPASSRACSLALAGEPTDTLNPKR
ncbi:MAG: 2-phospho-L-lactate guanylyltransferase [Caldimonas sp.]